VIVGSRAATATSRNALLPADDLPRVKPMDRLAQEEIFGRSVGDPGRGLRRRGPAVNQTLIRASASSIFTRDANTGVRAMRDFETRNRLRERRHQPAPRRTSRSVAGRRRQRHREAGHAALDTFTEWKSIYVDFSGRLQRRQIDNQA
jgi:aldehyde dehydrogenase (NAD+)